MAESFEGGCLCGAVRYRATGAGRSATLCHCTSCRRASAAPAVAWVTFPLAAFAYTRGEPARYRSSPPVVRSFCARCGTPLTYQHEAFADAVDVTTASLDEPARFPPVDHTWTSERLSWWRPEPRWPEFPRSRFEGGEKGDTEVIGVDHVYLTISDLARARAFYASVLGALGFDGAEEPIGGDPHAHWWNRALQVSIRPARNRAAHDPYAAGLHHLCFQVRDRAAVDAAHAKLRALGLEASAPRLYPEYNPDYYATFFSDPDGIRLEIVARKAKRDEIVATWNER